jgi:hypothetical protein
MNTSTEIIQKITSKPDWKSKIMSDEISEKWIRELCVNGYDHNFVFNIIDILKKYAEYTDNSTSELEYYDWFIRTDYAIEEVVGKNDSKQNDSKHSYGCSCNCLICQGKEYKLDSDYESEESDDEHDLEAESILLDNCPCKIDSSKSKKKFTDKYIIQVPDLIDQSLKDNFTVLVDQLPKTNFHPGSNNQMVDLFHPSMYPFIKGISDNKLSPEIVEGLDEEMIFQWLPSEMYVRYLDQTDQTDKADNISQTEQIDQTHSSKLTSYINNLCEPNLIKPIEQIFNKFVPHFNKLLDSMYANNLIETKTVLTNCQVIIKAQEINLDPTKPDYQEGSWHLEGTKHEHIIATGIYYYEMTNVDDNYLNFRVKVINPNYVYYPQNCTKYVDTHYGFDSFNSNFHDSYEKIPCISLEPVKTCEDLCLVFPNTFQHKVSKINLTDPTKNGSRKILVFFLIDPNNRIISTADIEPQQICISETDARIYQDILMFERKYESKVQKSVFEREWSLCEH